jgi:hypothetical protein
MNSDGTPRDTERLICEGIRNRHLIRFVLEGCPRIAEPHDYGIIAGEHRLFFYQTGGASRSGRPLGWRWGSLLRISNLSLLDQHFAGARPVPSGRHQRWDHLIASVSRPTGIRVDVA